MNFWFIWGLYWGTNNWSFSGLLQALSRPIPANFSLRFVSILAQIFKFRQFLVGLPHFRPFSNLLKAMQFFSFFIHFRPTLMYLLWTHSKVYITLSNFRIFWTSHVSASIIGMNCGKHSLDLWDLHGVPLSLSFNVWTDFVSAAISKIRAF